MSIVLYIYFSFFHLIIAEVGRLGSVFAGLVTKTHVMHLLKTKGSMIVDYSRHFALLIQDYFISN